MISLNFRKIAKCRLSEAGTAALEFGLLAPLLVLLVVGSFEVGSSVYKGMQAQNAAEAGAVYASKYGFDTMGISNAVTNATTAAGVTASPAPSLFCGCPAASGLTATACSSTCSGGSAPGHYIQINAQITHTPMLTFSGLVTPATITGQAVVRTF